MKRPKTTEADVEITHAYKLLVDTSFLSIPEDSIRGKTYLAPTVLDKQSGKTHGHLPDFSVWLDALPLLIVEVKKPEVNTAVGYREGTLYAHHLNKQFRSRLNPCGVVIATNGVKLPAGMWDASPALELNVVDIQPGSAALASLQELCAFPRLLAVVADFKRLLRPSQFITPYTLAGGVALLNAREPPNSFAAPLSPALIRYFTSQQQNTNKEVYEDAYVSSDETSNYDNVLSVLMRERLVEIRGSLSETLKPTKRRESRLSKTISAFAENRPHGHLQLITGAVGTGKSLFVRRYKELLQSSEERESSYWAFIDFNNAPKGLNEAEQWLCQSFIESFDIENHYNALDSQNWPQVFSLELNQRKSIYEDIAKSSPEQAAMARANDLNTWISDPKKTAFGLTRHFLGERQKVIVVVMDNADRLGTEEQLEVFRLSLWFMDQSRSFIILNLRDETYERFKNEKPLDTYKAGVTFHISPPPFIPILRRRIELCGIFLTKNTPETLEYVIPSGSRILYPNTLLGEFVREIYVEIFERQENSTRLIQGLSGLDIRDALNIFESILRSGHIHEDAITSLVAGGGAIRLTEEAVLRSLMRGEYKFHSDRSAFVKNILYCEASWVRPSNFLQVDILYLLYSKRNVVGTIGLEGYCTVIGIADEFQLRGYVLDDVVAAINMMLKSRLLESDHFRRQLDSAEDSVKVTYSGFIHMRLLLGSLEYLYGILPTTPVFNAAKADRIKISLEREASGRLVSSAMQLSAVHALLEHLEEAFHEEMSSFPAFGGVGTGAYYALSEVKQLVETYRDRRARRRRSNPLDLL